MEQIEGFVNKVVAQFESKPLATTLKGLIILWLLKEVVKIFKK